MVNVLDSGSKGLGSSSGPWVIVLCSWARQFTLAVFRFTKEVILVLMNCYGNAADLVSVGSLKSPIFFWLLLLSHDSSSCIFFFSRHCGRLLCAKCSSKQIPIIKYELTKPVRVCDVCFEMLTSGAS